MSKVKSKVAPKNAKSRRRKPPATPAKPAVDNDAVTYVLRTCPKNMISHSHFRWPIIGPVECDDWQPHDQCGNGLHGLLMGEGKLSLMASDHDAKWLVVEVKVKDIVHVTQYGGGKVKFPRGNVIYCGDRLGAIDVLLSKGADPQKVLNGNYKHTNHGSATVDKRGIAIAPLQAVAGSYGLAKSTSHFGIALAGDSGVAIAQQGGAAIAGPQGLARTHGDRGVALTAAYGNAIAAGECGRAIAWHNGKVEVGQNGIAFVGDTDSQYSTFKGRVGALFIGVYSLNDQPHVVTARVGVDGIKPNIEYSLNLPAGKFVPVNKPKRRSRR